MTSQNILRTILTLFLIGIHSLWGTAKPVVPSGGWTAEPLSPGSGVEVRWTDDLQAERVHLELWNADMGHFTTIATNVDAADGAYAWQLPATLPPGQRYRFVVRDAERPIRAEFSTSWVSIGAPLPIATSVSAEIDHGTDVHIQPLPASEFVTVTWSERDTERLEIFDAAQQVIASVSVPAGAALARIDLRAVASGSHFLRVHSRDGRIVVKPLPVLR